MKEGLPKIKRKYLMVACLVVAIVVATIAVAYYESNSDYGARTNVDVGVILYLWYDGRGYTYGHWNESDMYPKWNVVDKPILGYYDSGNTSVIQNQLENMQYTGIDFIFLSWWGWGSGNTVDDAAKAVFSTVESYAPTMKVAIMVEDFNNSGLYNFTAIDSYILSTYAIPYSNIYMKLNNRPLVVWWNGVNTTDIPVNRAQILSDQRVEPRILGHRSDYVNWYAWTPSSVNPDQNPDVGQQIDGFTCIEPRYDDSYIGRIDTFDQKLDYLYDQEWNAAINAAKNGSVRMILIYSWNEYHERSFIEPAVDYTSGKSPTYLLNKTKSFISEIARSLSN